MARLWTLVYITLIHWSMVSSYIPRKINSRGLSTPPLSSVYHVAYKTDRAIVLKNNQKPDEYVVIPTKHEEKVRRNIYESDDKQQDIDNLVDRDKTKYYLGADRKNWILTPFALKDPTEEKPESTRAPELEIPPKIPDSPLPIEKTNNELRSKRKFSPWGGKRNFIKERSNRVIRDKEKDSNWQWKRSNTNTGNLLKNVKFSPWGGKRSDIGPNNSIMKISSKMIFNREGLMDPEENKHIFVTRNADDEDHDYVGYGDLPVSSRPNIEQKDKVQLSPWSGKKSNHIIGHVWTAIREPVLDKSLFLFRGTDEK